MAGMGVNLAAAERIGAVIAGITLAVCPPARFRFLATAGGLALIAHGLTGSSLVYRALGINTARWDRQRLRQEREIDPVTRTSEDSFPASDPPAWTPVTGEVGRR